MPAEARFREDVATLVLQLEPRPAAGARDDRRARASRIHKLSQTRPFIARCPWIGRAQCTTPSRANTHGESRRGPLPVDPTLTAMLQLLQQSCSAELERARLQTMHTLAIVALPFLDPPTALNLLATAIPEECREQASPQLRSWLSLYESVAARDPGRMADAGEALLERRGPVSTRRAVITRWPLRCLAGSPLVNPTSPPAVGESPGRCIRGDNG